MNESYTLACLDLNVVASIHKEMRDIGVSPLCSHDIYTWKPLKKNYPYLPNLVNVSDLLKSVKVLRRGIAVGEIDS